MSCSPRREYRYHQAVGTDDSFVKERQRTLGAAICRIAACLNSPLNFRRDFIADFPLPQVCQLRFVSVEGFTPNFRAQFVPKSAFRARSVPIWDHISLYFSRRLPVSDRPRLPWHGRGRPAGLVLLVGALPESCTVQRGARQGPI
jgi:hypothetical protein